MERKGEVLNQLAIISDLLEKINLDTKSSTIIIELSKMEFERVFDKIQEKQNRKMETPKNTFTLTIGNIDIIFNTSNV